MTTEITQVLKSGVYTWYFQINVLLMDSTCVMPRASSSVPMEMHLSSDVHQDPKALELESLSTENITATLTSAMSTLLTRDTMAISKVYQCLGKNNIF